jgi:hypothetical protein
MRSSRGAGRRPRSREPMDVAAVAQSLGDQLDGVMENLERHQTEAFNSADTVTATALHVAGDHLECARRALHQLERRAG